VGDSRGGGVSCCGQSDSVVVEFEFQVDSFVYTYIIYAIYTLFLFDEHSTGSWLSRFVV
jgi:hypothetical protein